MTTEQAGRIDEIETSLAAERPTRVRWMILALLMVMTAIAHFNRLSISTAGESRIRVQYGLSPEAMGWVYSAFLITYTAGMIPGGWFIDRFGAKASLMVVGFGSALFVGAAGLVGLLVREPFFALIGLIAMRAMMGLLSAPLHPACAAAVGHWISPSDRARCNGLSVGSALLGIAAAPIVFGAMIDRFDWPTAFLIMGAVTALLACMWSVMAVDRPERHTRVNAAELRSILGRKEDEFHEAELADLPAPPVRPFDLLRNRSLVLLTLSYAAVGYFQYLFFYWMNYYFHEVLKLSEWNSRIYTTIPLMAMAVGMPSGGWLSDRLERAIGSPRARCIVPMSGMCLGAVFLALGVLARQPEWIVAWFALALGAVGAAEGPSWSTAIELGGIRGGSAAALFNTGGNAGGILAPIVTPWVGQRFGWTWAVGLGAMVCIVGAFSWLGINPAERRKETHASEG